MTSVCASSSYCHKAVSKRKLNRSAMGFHSHCCLLVLGEGGQKIKVEITAWSTRYSGQSPAWRAPRTPYIRDTSVETIKEFEIPLLARSSVTFLYQTTSPQQSNLRDFHNFRLRFQIHMERIKTSTSGKRRYQLQSIPRSTNEIW